MAAWFDRSLDVSKDADVKNDVRMLTRIDGIVKLPAYREQDTKNAAIKRHGGQCDRACDDVVRLRAGRRPHRI